MADYPLVWIVIGVAGSGKTTVGRLLSERLECDFLEGDRRHPQANILKMHAQMPLTDKDRRPWLKALKKDIHRAVKQNRETVLTCSALKAAYRKKLTSPGRVQLVLLKVPTAELERRLSQRPNHYMTLAMLHSQLATFEEIEEAEGVITITGDLPPGQTVDQILEQAAHKFPALQQDWWKRGGD